MSDKTEIKTETQNALIEAFIDALRDHAPNITKNDISVEQIATEFDAPEDRAFKIAMIEAITGHDATADQITIFTFNDAAVGFDTMEKLARESSNVTGHHHTYDRSHVRFFGDAEAMLEKMDVAALQLRLAR